MCRTPVARVMTATITGVTYLQGSQARLWLHHAWFKRLHHAWLWLHYATLWLHHSWRPSSPLHAQFWSMCHSHSIKEAPVVHQPAPGHHFISISPYMPNLGSLSNSHGLMAQGSQASQCLFLSNSCPIWGLFVIPMAWKRHLWSTDLAPVNFNGSKKILSRGHMLSTIPPSFNLIRPAISESISNKAREFSPLPKARFARLG